jgi:predicted SnoaL-like aldol condensation-catalyzing enzyme
MGIVNRMIGAIAVVVALAFLAPVANADEALTARNKEIVRNFYTTVFVGRNVDAAPKFLSPGYIQHTAGIAQGLKGFVDAFRANFAKKVPPDYKREIIRIIGDNDIVILFNRQSGTLPNGWHQVVLQFDMFRLKGGMIVEHWDADPGSTV